jgi:hypothetical protein
VSLTDSIIRVIEGAGCAVSVHRMPGYVEMHAVPLSGDVEQQKISRCADDEDEAVFRAAAALAEMVGIDLAD